MSMYILLIIKQQNISFDRNFNIIFFLVQYTVMPQYPPPLITNAVHIYIHNWLKPHTYTHTPSGTCSLPQACATPIGTTCDWFSRTLTCTALGTCSLPQKCARHLSTTLQVSSSIDVSKTCHVKLN